MKIVAINGSHTGKKVNTHFLIEKQFRGFKKKALEKLKPEQIG